MTKEVKAPLPQQKKRQEVFEDYDSFVEKFKPKKTTDDCYTPPLIYDAILKWLGTQVDLKGKKILSPFYPGRDYKSEDYSGDCIVVDNPPFSIFAEIKRFYLKRGIKFFLFAPHLTLQSSHCGNEDITYIICGVSVTYDNGAYVNTSFVSNLFGSVRLWVANELYRAVKEANEESRADITKQVPKYTYPSNVTSAALLSKIAPYVNLKIDKKDCYLVSGLDSQKTKGKKIFGKGWLLSEKAAAEKAAAEKAAAEKAAAKEYTVWELSERERQIIESLGR